MNKTKNSALYSSKIELLRAAAGWRLQRKNTANATKAQANVFNRSGTSEVTPSVARFCSSNIVLVVPSWGGVSDLFLLLHHPLTKRFEIFSQRSNIQRFTSGRLLQGFRPRFAFVHLQHITKSELKMIIKCACREHWISSMFVVWGMRNTAKFEWLNNKLTLNNPLNACCFYGEWKLRDGDSHIKMTGRLVVPLRAKIVVLVSVLKGPQRQFLRYLLDCCAKNM